MAGKPRVHEIAHEYGIDSKVALAKLKDLGEYVRGVSSTIEPPVARKLRAALEADGLKPAPADTAPAAKAAPKATPAPVESESHEAAPTSRVSEPVSSTESPAAATSP